jgi:hypothetical protein
MKKGVKAITGNTTLQSGNWENFHVSDWYKGTPMEFRNEAHVKWAVYHLENGVTPVKVLEKDQGHFRFKSKAVGEKFLIVAYIFEPELSTGLEITVLDNNVPEILSIKISDINDQPFEGPIYTGQVINCHASTVGMVGHHVVFSLWEDNDQDSTNNDDNSKHRLVQEKITRAGSLGVAHAQFQVASDFTKLAEAAMGNGSAMKQYYITVFAMGLLKPDAGTKLIYPDERKAITKDHLAGKKPEKDQVPPYKERIVLKEKGEKKTVKSSSYSTQHSTTKKITNVLLLDEKYKPINNTFNGKTLIVYIQSQGLINHKIQFKLYEHDYGSANDILLNQEYTITGDNCKIIVHLDRIPRKRGGEFMEEGFEQELFADIEVKELQKHIVSKKIDVDAGVFKIDVDNTNKKSYAEVGEKAEKKDGTCVCNQQNLVWGNKIGCKERKKVIEVAKNLNVDPNWLMSVMALETAKTFSPSIDNGIGYVGLIQFGKDAAQTVKTTQKDLVKMEFIEQMDYVQKFLIGKKDKFKTLVDLYLAVLYPSACGHGSERDYVVLKNKAYKNNPLFFQEEDEIIRDKKGKIKSRHPKENGVTYIWEVDMAIQAVYSQGLSNKTSAFTCEASKKADTLTNCKCTKTHIDLRPTITWHTQFDSQWGDKKAQNLACWKASQQILNNSGLGSTSGYPSGAIQLAKEIDKHTKMSYLPEGLKAGIDYLDQQLEINHPVLVGVNHDLNYRGEKNIDHTTDHFVVIVGRNCDDNGAYYLFYEVGTSFKKSGASDENKLYILSDRIEGKTAYNSSKLYQISQVRKNN